MQSSTIISINKDGIIQSVDKNCCKLFGYDLEELVGHPIRIIIPPPYKEQHDSYISNYMKTKVPKIIGKSRLVEGQHKDGSIFPVRLSVSKVGDGDNVIFIGMIDRVEDKSALVTISADGTVVNCNQNIEELFGYKPTELNGKSICTLMPSPHAEKHNSYITAYLNGATPRAIGHIRNVAAKHKNGTVFPISLQVEELRIGNGVLLFRGRMEAVDTTEVMFTIDENGTIVSCNQNFVQSLCGYSSNELVGNNISILLPTLHQDSSMDSITPVPQVASDNNNAKPTATSADGEKMKKQKLDETKPGLVLSDTWKTPGVHKKRLQHKDGSIFDVCLEIFPFQNEEGKWMYSGKMRRKLDHDLDHTHDGCAFSILFYSILFYRITSLKLWNEIKFLILRFNLVKSCILFYRFVEIYGIYVVV